MKIIKLYNKVLVTIVVVFIISVSSSTSLGITLKKKNFEITLDLVEISLSGEIILVDDVPDWGPNNPPEDYTNIQDAIDASNDLDIIYVFEGTYNEKIVIDKSIYLIGENKEKTIVKGDGTGDVIYISANEVIVSGFTIKNSGEFEPDNHQAGIEIDSNLVKITDNIISNNLGNGIYFNSSGLNEVTDNKIYENHIGVFFEYSIMNMVSKNVITNNDYGACLYFSNNNTVTGNDISFNGLGMCTNNATLNNISSNIFSYNTNGIFPTDSSNNLFSSNNFIKNKRRAVLFRGFCKNQWTGNYWNRPRLLPKPIFGRMGLIIGLIPWVNFDWRPALKLNEI